MYLLTYALFYFCTLVLLYFCTFVHCTILPLNKKILNMDDKEIHVFITKYKYMCRQVYTHVKCEFNANEVAYLPF